MNIKYYFSKFMKKIQVSAIKSSTLHKTSKVASKSHLVRVSLGKYSYIGSECTVLNTDLGNFCSVADNTIIGGASHPIDWISTSPVFHEGKNILNKNFSTHKYNPSKKTKIGNDVWIGNNCLIKSGLEIADGAVIGMGSIVTKDVGPYEIWAGNPAKKIRSRFDKNTISKLEKIKWWDFTDNEISEVSVLINKPEEFLRKLEEL